MRRKCNENAKFHNEKANINAKMFTLNAIDQRKSLLARIPRILLCQIRLNVTSSIQNEVSCQRVHYTLRTDPGTFRSSTLP